MNTLSVKNAEIEAIEMGLGAATTEVNMLRWEVCDIRTVLQSLDARLSLLEKEDDTHPINLSPLLITAVKEKIQAFISSYSEFSDPDEFCDELARLLGVEASTCY